MKMMFGSKQTLGLRISRLRKDKGWTQKDLADKAGITQNQVSRIEKDKMQPRRSTIQALAKSFGIKSDDLEALALLPAADDNAAQLAQEDPELAALFSQVSLLSDAQREAVRVTLRSMLACQRMREVANSAAS